MIYFDDWLLMVDAGPVIARQYDNLTRRLEILGQFPEGWDWTLLVQADKHLDIIALAPMEGGMGVDLTAEMLALSGYYTVQLKGVQGELVRHTNQVRIFIPDSLSGDANWPEVPSEFSQAEARIREMNEHPPIPGDGGYWLVWNLEKKEYVTSDLPLPKVPEGPAGKAATIKVGETVTGDPDTPAKVENTGTENAAVLRFTIPRGAVGPTGATPAISVEVTGLPAGAEPTVEVSGTPEAPVIALGIPAGRQGDPGGKGDPGDPGDPGQTPNITIGQVETLPAGSAVTASITGETPNLVLNLGIPQGQQGDPGQAATIEIVETETVSSNTPAAMVELPESTPQARRYKAQVPQGPAGIGLPAISGPEDAGRVPVVNPDGTGWLLGESDSGHDWRYLGTFTLPENAQVIEVSADENGEPFRFSGEFVISAYIGTFFTNYTNGGAFVRITDVDGKTYDSNIVSIASVTGQTAGDIDSVTPVFSRSVYRGDVKNGKLYMSSLSDMKSADSAYSLKPTHCSVGLDCASTEFNKIAVWRNHPDNKLFAGSTISISVR